MADAPLLSMRNVTVEFRLDRGWGAAIEDVSLDVGARECVGLVGESGSGKSVSALAVLGLLPRRGARVTNGEILFSGRDLLKARTRELRAIRGGRIAMIFQDPMSSLNPVMSVGEQIVETLRLHRRLSRTEARREAIELLDFVRIADPRRRIDEYPHQLSGGMRQRVMIAQAIACQPELLIADEPTTALDVTIQGQILELLRDLRHRLGMAVLLISHDLGVVAEFVDKVVVMYAGQVVEQGPVADLFARPIHPYTEGLMAAIPRLDAQVTRLSAIPGRIPGIGETIDGCRFHPRCAFAIATCRAAPTPPLEKVLSGLARCPPRLAALGEARLVEAGAPT
jgi:oligopeptide/dipeptide ABC transporter ATP-binding protein